jgi:hypothetical protein
MSPLSGCSARFNGSEEAIHVRNIMVGRHYEKQRSGIIPHGQYCRNSGGRRRVAPKRLKNDSSHAGLGRLELLSNREPVFRIGDHE